MPAEMRQLAVRIAWSWYGTPYEWADEDFFGADCSGFISEVLYQVGVEKPYFRGVTQSDDYPSISLADLYPEVSLEHLNPGCLVFYGNGNNISHVMLAIDKHFVIGSTGGDSTTSSLADADAKRAYVKVMPIDYRPIIKIVDPFAFKGNQD